ncbi:unnamed protein product [Rotaria sp. Silwood1]|nr:unnamed protein product [Rotaria sp. Silwood1]
MQSPRLLGIPLSSAQYLSSSDDVLLANIFNAYENTCMTAKKTRFQSFPAVQHTSVHEFFNEISHAFPVFIEYFKNIPEFNNIIVDDRIRLLKNHFCIIVNINEFLMHPETSSNLVVTWTNLFGIDLTERLLKRNQLLESFVYDLIVLKLVLIVLVFSSSNSRNIDQVDLDLICDNPLSIFAVQNIYVELLWKYILSRSPNEKDAVKFFNKLMMFESSSTSYDKSSKNSIELVHIAKAYVETFILRALYDAVHKASEQQSFALVFEQIFHVFAIHTLRNQATDFIRLKLLTAEQVYQLETSTLPDMYARLRPNLVTLVDAFDFHNNELDSCLGRYDGQAYEALMERARLNPSNRYKVHPVWMSIKQNTMSKL